MPVVLCRIKPWRSVPAYAEGHRHVCVHASVHMSVNLFGTRTRQSQARVQDNKPANLIHTHTHTHTHKNEAQKRALTRSLCFPLPLFLMSRCAHSIHPPVRFIPLVAKTNACMHNYTSHGRADMLGTHGAWHEQQDRIKRHNGTNYD